MYINRKMRPAETILGIGGRGIKENNVGGEFNMVCLIYFKNFCKCCNVPPAQQQ
jgi:hypothetical protein